MVVHYYIHIHGICIVVYWELLVHRLFTEGEGGMESEQKELKTKLKKRLKKGEDPCKAYE